jgi:hypothetical protein
MTDAVKFQLTNCDGKTGDDSAFFPENFTNSLGRKPICYAKTCY